MGIRTNAVAWCALFVALGGTGYAAIELPRHSVGTRELKRHAVTNSRVKPGTLAVSALSRDARKALSADATVAEGAVLPPSCPGAPDGCGTFPAGTAHTGFAQCPEGKQVIAGGFEAGDPTNAVASVSAPLPDRSGWKVTLVLLSPSEQSPFGGVYAICA